MIRYILNWNLGKERQINELLTQMRHVRGIFEWLPGRGQSGHLGTGRRIYTVPGEVQRNLYFTKFKALFELHPTDPKYLGEDNLG